MTQTNQPSATPSAVETTAEQAQQSGRLAFGLYAGTVLLFWTAQYLYVATLPTYVQGKVADLAAVGAVLSMYGLVQFFTRLPLGLLTDWVGRRKPFILLGPLFIILGVWTLARAAGTPGLALGRGMTGFASSAWVPMVAAFTVLFPPRQAVRASVLITLVSNLGCIVGTGLNGQLNEIGGYNLAFGAAAAVAGVALLLGLTLPEKRRRARNVSVRNLALVATRFQVLLPSLLCGLSEYVVFAATFGFLPIVSQGLGLSATTQGLLTSLNLVAQASGNFVVVAISRRIRERRVAYLSFGSLALGAATAAVAGGPAQVVMSQVLIGIGHGCAYPLLMGLSVRHVADGERTAAVGTFQSVYSIGMFAGPIISGFLARSLGIPAMFAITAAGCLALGWFGVSKLQE